MSMMKSGNEIIQCAIEICFMSIDSQRLPVINEIAMFCPI